MHHTTFSTASASTYNFIYDYSSFQYSPIISPNEFQYVHHILVYLCDSLDQSDVGTSAECGGAVSSSVSECLAGELIAAWAVGGNVSSYSTTKSK